MTTFSADTFTRTNGPVGSAETGGAWSASGAAATWAVASDQLTGKCPSGYAGLLTVNDGQSDGAVQTTFVAGSSGGLVFRYTSANDYWVLSFGSAQYIRLSYFNNGYTTKADPGAVAQTGDVLRVELTGPLIVAYRNNKQILSISDSTRATATSHGLTTSTGTSTYDNFSHVSLTATTPTPPTTPTPTPTPTVHRFFNIGGVAVPVS